MCPKPNRRPIANAAPQRCHGRRAVTSSGRLSRGETGNAWPATGVLVWCRGNTFHHQIASSTGTPANAGAHGGFVGRTQAQKIKRDPDFRPLLSGENLCGRSESVAVSENRG